jgi:hypothetical protein
LKYAPTIANFLDFNVSKNVLRLLGVRFKARNYITCIIVNLAGPRRLKLGKYYLKHPIVQALTIMAMCFTMMRVSL